MGRVLSRQTVPWHWWCRKKLQARDTSSAQRLKTGKPLCAIHACLSVFVFRCIRRQRKRCRSSAWTLGRTTLCTGRKNARLHFDQRRACSLRWSKSQQAAGTQRSTRWWQGAVRSCKVITQKRYCAKEHIKSSPSVIYSLAKRKWVGSTAAR